ncbi:MAG: ABC transporter substrate-binding protein [Gammaproteobacteria bacterium]|nr:ABC transporter substrate-binding protein [Gammaproteobacteria bacterium]
MFNYHRHTTVQAVFVLFISLFCFSTAYAESASTDSIPVPQQLMEDTSKKMIQAFKESTEAIRKDPEVAHQLINEHLVPKVNFPLMSRWVLGKNWKKATPVQQTEFVAEFQALVVKFYSKALIQFLSKNNLTNDIITFHPFRGKLKGKYATIRSQVNPLGGGEPIKVNYDLYHNKSGQWQVYDVSVEGISLVTTYRSSFKQIVSKKGMDALLAELKNKNSSLYKDEPEPLIAEKQS